MWSEIKKTVNSKLEKTIDKIIIDKVNKSYNKGEYVPLNKMLEGEKQLKPSMHYKNITLMDNKTVNGSVTLEIKLNDIENGVYALYGIFKNAYTTNATYSITILKNNILIFNQTITPYFSFVGEEKTFAILNLACQKGDNLQITVKDNHNGYDYVSLFLGAEEKQIPYITIVNKESE